MNQTITTTTLAKHTPITIEVTRQTTENRQPGYQRSNFERLKAEVKALYACGREYRVALGGKLIELQKEHSKHGSGTWRTLLIELNIPKSTAQDYMDEARGKSPAGDRSARRRTQNDRAKQAQDALSAIFGDDPQDRLRLKKVLAKDPAGFRRVAREALRLQDLYGSKIVLEALGDAYKVVSKHGQKFA